MSQLLELQRRVARVVMQPLTQEETMRHRTVDGRPIDEEANCLIRPNSRLTSFERLEIYNRQYWFRVLSCFAEDFPGLRAIVGGHTFDALSRAYLNDCPSVSFTLRNLGSQLENWLRRNPDWIAAQKALALDMVRLEWAHIEAFDGACDPVLTPADIEAAGLDLRVRLQPYVRLLELAYPVDDLLIAVRQYQGETSTASNNARIGQFRRRVRRYAVPEQQPIYLAVHRMDDSVYYKRLERDSFVMLQALASGESLETAMERSFQTSSMSEEQFLSAVQSWFAHWAELGWFSRPSIRSNEA